MKNITEKINENLINEGKWHDDTAKEYQNVLDGIKGVLRRYTDFGYEEGLKPLIYKLEDFCKEIAELCKKETGKAIKPF